MSEEMGEVQEVEPTEHNDQADTEGDGRVKKANAEAAAYRKQLRAAEAELRKVREASMSEQEKAVAEAEARGRATAMADAGKRLALAEIRAEAAGRVEQGTLDGFLDYADLSRFVDEQGEPDTKAIAAAVKRLGGAGGNAPDFDGGARTTSKPNDMNALIRRQAGVG